MASAALPAREEVVWRAGKRPRAEVRRRPFEEVKWALLTKEQEMERQRVQEAIRRLDAIEEMRKRARERKIDRDNRRIAFAALLERSTLMLQRCERGRQGRRVARRRVRATKIITQWMLAMVRRAAVKKAIRNRTILKMMLSAEALVEETLAEACFVLKNVVAIREFQQRRFARMIQKVLRKRVALVCRSAAIIVRAARGWLARGVVRRARIRRSILKHRGSLSRRARGLSETDPFALTAVSEKSGDAAREGRWWDVGPSIAARPRWGVQRVEREVERSRQRAASLGDLIRSGQEVAVRRGSGGAAAAVVGDGSKRDTAHRQSSDPLKDSEGVRPAKNAAVGFKKCPSSQRATSMIDPREAEAAAWQDELSKRQARKEALAMVLDYKTLSLREKHLLRQREFDLEKRKRRLAAEKEMQKQAQLKAQEAMNRAKQRAREVERLRRQEEESAQNRLEKIKSYMEEKAARELAERKTMVARERKERQAKEIAKAKRQAANALFEKEKEERLERARRKRRAEEAKTAEAAAPRGRKGSARKAAAPTEKPAAATALNQQGKKTVAKSSGALDPIAVGDREGRKRRRDRSNGVGGPVQGARRSRVAAGVRDGRLKPSQSAALPALPTVPPWKAMAGRGDKKRTRRRPPKREVEREKRGACAVGDPKGIRQAKDSATDLKIVLLRSRGGGSVAADGFNRIEIRNPESGVRGAQLGAVAFDEGERGGAEEDKGSTEQGSLTDGEFLNFCTLDSVFLPPGSGADSGGAEELGATSAQGERSWKGRGSRSNRSSSGDENLGLCFSYTDTDRVEGAAMVGGVVKSSGVRFADGADTRAVTGTTEESSGGFVPGTPRVVCGHGQAQEETPRPGERESEGNSCLVATDQSLTPDRAQEGALESDPVAAQSTLSPDNISALGESRTLIEHRSDGIVSAESAASFTLENAYHVSTIRTESGEPHAGTPKRDACGSIEETEGSDRDQEQSSNSAVATTMPLPLSTSSTSPNIEGLALLRTGTASSAESGHASSHRGGCGAAALASG